MINVHWGVLSPWSIIHQEVFLYSCSDACSKYTKKSSRLPGVFITGGSRLTSVFITGELFWTPGSHFTDFKEHTTIFNGSIILKIDCKESFYRF